MLLTTTIAPQFKLPPRVRQEANGAEVEVKPMVTKADLAFIGMSQDMLAHLGCQFTPSLPEATAPAAAS